MADDRTLSTETQYWTVAYLAMKSLRRMLKLQEAMMREANHAQSAWSADTISEMNEAPIDARATLRIAGSFGFGDTE